MKYYSKEESDKVLAELQKKLDATGKTIRFKELWIKTKPSSYSHVIGTALNMHPTVTTGGKREYSQFLGSSRSLQDLYLICKHYFPEVTIFDVKDNLQKRIDNHEIYFWLCSTFRRIMFAKGTSYSSNENIASKYGINI